MSAEDLDKLFRDKLQNRPVTPSNEAWERLQARMQMGAQQETPNPFLIPAATEQKKEGSPVRMWYYSAAAAVTMLLSVGLWVNRGNIDPMQPSATVAQVTTGQDAPQKATAGSKGTTTEVASAQGQTEDSFQAPVVSETTVAQPELLASTRGGKPAFEKQKQGVVSYPGVTTKEVKKAEVASPAVNSPEPVMMAAVTPAKASEVSKPATEAAPLEIIVKFDNTQATTSLAQASTTVDTTPEEEEPSGSSGRILKGILKQVKNLKDGEKVNLQELGISKHTYALETRIGNKKITKSIEL